MFVEKSKIMCKCGKRDPSTT